MSTITRISQLDAQVGIEGEVARVSTLAGDVGLDIATTIRMSHCTLQVGLAYIVPHVTQISAQAGFSLIIPTRTSAYIKVL